MLMMKTMTIKIQIMIRTIQMNPAIFNQMKTEKSYKKEILIQIKTKNSMRKKQRTNYKIIKTFYKMKTQIIKMILTKKIMINKIQMLPLKMIKVVTQMIKLMNKNKYLNQNLNLKIKKRKLLFPNIINL